MSAKIRLDQLLLERGLVDSWSKAQAVILAGLVYTGERRLTSAGTKIDVDTPVSLRAPDQHWVSRGGLKRAHGLAHFKFDPAGLVCIDVGASTGGFTDVLLTHGAGKVYAIDVGYGQLAHKLRTDPRVVVRERTNARALDRTQVPDLLNAIVCDASFIGLRTVLPASLALAAPGAWLVALIKPQFEVGKERVGKKGVVRDPALHEEVCATIAAWLADQAGWEVLGIVPSPITGPEGNVEFLIGARRGA